MIKEEGSVSYRTHKKEEIRADLVVVGGGMSGTCCAITAARAGANVILVQDRPVLGGNASSEVRLWILGATSHMGNNNRWAREGGVIDEILVENTYRNPEGNAVIFDTVLLEKVTNEPNITLLLNTVVYEAEKSAADIITSVKGFCSQNSTQYILRAPLFCDASGDGVLGFLAGAAFRMGAESKEEFGEKFAPDKEYGELLGHTMYFYSKDTGTPVRFVPPAFALKDITQIPRYKNFKINDYGCRLWWIEYGGRLDTIHETEKIKWELWKIVYGVWNHIKNSGEFPDAENLTLEWVSTIPGKRESRRFEGDYMLIQQDVIEQRKHVDAVAFGGWSIDLHPADGVYSEKSGCNQWHSKGVYQIPYRCFYSKNISNLFLAGRIISASHVAFGSSRVMGTAACGGQAVGMAAAICSREGRVPKDLLVPEKMHQLQKELMKVGHYIPELQLHDEQDLIHHAAIIASSELELKELPANGEWLSLEYGVAQMIPLKAGNIPAFEIVCKSDKDTVLEVELRNSSKCANHTPDVTLEKIILDVKKGENVLKVKFAAYIDTLQYLFFTFLKNSDISLKTSETRITGILSVFNKFNKAVSNYGKQEASEDIGVDSFEFWCPQRRPLGQNLAFKLNEGLKLFPVENIKNGVARPVYQTNAWVAALDDPAPKLKVQWPQSKQIKRIELSFDTDFDHPMESSLMGHPESEMPFCIRNYWITNHQGNVLFQMKNNHQTRNNITLDQPEDTESLTFHFEHPKSNTPAAVFEIRCYGN